MKKQKGKIFKIESCLQCPFHTLFYYDDGPFIEIHSCGHPKSSGVLAMIDKDTDRNTIALFKYKWISDYCPLDDYSKPKKSDEK